MTPSTRDPWLERLQDKRLLIFDFDGTVADTTPMHAAAFAQVLGPLGIAVDYPRIAGLSTPDAMRLCLNEAGQACDEAALAALVAAKQQCGRHMIEQALQPLPGVDDFLRWARPRYRLAMVTSGSRRTVSQALEQLGYAGWFEPLICAEDVALTKPAPEGFLKALRLTGVPAEAALVFEDSPAGFRAAQAAGLDFSDARLNPWAIAQRVRP